MTISNTTMTRRRSLLTFAAAAGAIAVLPWHSAGAQGTADATATAPVQQLGDALLAAMKSGDHSAFADRYRALDPVVERVFNLDSVLATSVGLSWGRLPEAQKAVLAKAFRRYTVSSYVASFNSYSGESFQVSPAVRTVGPGEVVVQSRLRSSDGTSLALDYVMRRFPAGWQAVDVLTDGSISRVAVQRSDFRELLKAGGVPALANGLDHKVASLSGGMVG
jgi:phospholipid transport system substrate-binding protein